MHTNVYLNYTTGPKGAILIVYCKYTRLYMNLHLFPYVCLYLHHSYNLYMLYSEEENTFITTTTTNDDDDYDDYDDQVKQEKKMRK